MSKLIFHRIKWNSSLEKFIITLKYEDMEIIGECDRDYQYARIIKIKMIRRTK